TLDDRIHLAVQFPVDILALAANITLLLAIKSRTPPKMRAYSVFLLNGALFDAVTAVSGAMATTRVICQPDGSTVMVFLGPCTRVGSYFCHLNMSIQTYLINHSTLLLLMSFLYRQRLLTDVNPLIMSAESAKGVWRICGLCLLPTAIGTV
ncbi:hypothetical protein PFISCL1PPCAC_13887, partial [Pristionchus fissidentatus]